jgi:ribonuclease BN (tRNA processing enzyme)
VELIVMGAGPAYTDRRGAASAGYLVRAGEACLMLDMGQGTFPNLASTMDPSALSAVLVSHLHPDHFIDLVPLRHYLRYEFDPPRRMRVLGPADLGHRIDALHALPEFAAASLDVAPLGTAVRQIGPFTVETKLVAHTEESYAMRVRELREDDGTNGPALVYSGDCGNADDLIPLVHPGDVLLAEASFGIGPVPEGASHLTAAEAARVAVAGQASRLFLTHILMGYSRAETLAAAQAVFPGPVQLVTEGDRFEI